MPILPSKLQDALSMVETLVSSNIVGTRWANFLWYGSRLEEAAFFSTISETSRISMVAWCGTPS